MLLRLCIENYALIRKLDIGFHRGFSVITGETGAGKSILLGALELILGQRADTSVLFDLEKKCIVEGEFLLKGYELESFFSGKGLDYDNTTILRREINQAGKSRAFINDTPVNLTVLKELGERLVNIHSQNAITTLNESSFQLAVLDQFAGHDAQVKEYRQQYKDYRDLKRQLEQMQQDADNARKDHDYLVFLYEELRQAGLKPEEQHEMETRLAMLTHAEEIKAQLYNAYNSIMGNEPSMLDLLADIANSLGSVEKLYPALPEITDRLKSNLIDLKDIAKTVSDMSDKIDLDPKEAEFCSARLDLIYHLENKHQVSTVEALIEITNELEKKLDAKNHLDEKLSCVKKEILRVETDLAERAKQLSQKRKNIKSTLEKRISKVLDLISLQNSIFQIEVTDHPELSIDGMDRVRFMFSANKGVQPDEISRVASGGELSRLMLAIKSMISQNNLLPTIIFDEVDNGVSGEIAGKMGNILQAMAKSMQVIAITHLPQIAGKGSHHYLVFKSESAQTAKTQILELSSEERVHEIAKMLSNEVVTDAARTTAKELLNN